MFDLSIETLIIGLLGTLVVFLLAFVLLVTSELKGALQHYHDVVATILNGKSGRDQ